jgi:hypothetical protein
MARHWMSSGASRAVAGRLRRAQTFLRTLGIEVTFSREGRAGTRMISVSTSAEHTVSTVSSVRHNGSRLDQNIVAGAETVGIDRADEADGDDANAAFRFE